MTEQKTVALGFDIETASADLLYGETYDGGPFVRLVGIIGDASPDGVTGVDASTMARYLDTADAVYGHNIFRFDIPALARHAGADYDALAGKAWDTAVLERLVDPPGAKHATKAGHYGLDETAHRYGHAGKTGDLAALALRHAGEEPGTKAEKTARGYERIPQDDPEYRDYLRGDLAATQHVQRSVFQRVTNWGYAAREMRVAAIQNRMPFNGWRVDREVLAERVDQEEERRRGAVKRLSEDYGVPLTKADGKPSLAPWATDGGRLALEDAFRQAGAKYVPRTKTGAMAIGKDPMGPDHWVDSRGKRRPGMLHPDAYGTVPAVVELCGVLAEATGATAKYAEIQRALTREGRVHGGIGEDQASGRWAMTKPSLTNLGKRGPAIRQRDPFVPELGHVHLTCDLSQVDMRGLAGLSQDTAYMALFAPGRDAHMDMAEVYFGERTKEARGRTKPINHGLGYGQSDAAISARNGIPVDQVQAATLRRAFAYPRLIQWTEEVRQLGADGHLLDNGFGRLMRCDPNRAYTQAPALMGQGCARDLMCEALLRLVELDRRVTPYLRAVVHDEVVLSVPEGEADYWRGVLSEAFTFEWRGVPILSEVSAPGTNWAECYLGE